MSQSEKTMSLGALATALPSMHGFDLSGSLVLVGSAGKQIRVTARIDLPEPWEVESVLTQTLSALVHNGSTAVVAVAYLSEAKAAPVLHLLPGLAAECGLEVVARLVAGDEVHAFPSGALAPAPSAGEYPEVTTTRAELEEMLTPATVAEEVGSALVGVEMFSDREAFEAWRRVFGAGDAEPSAQDFAMVSMSAAVPTLRDAVVMWACPTLRQPELIEESVRDASRAVFDVEPPWVLPTDPEAVERLWERVAAACQHLPTGTASGFAAVAAVALWWCQRGALSAMCTERARSDAKICGYAPNLLDLVERCLTQGINARDLGEVDR